jgi:endonuclease-3
MPLATDAKRQAGKVAKLLARHYADAQCALHFSSPLQLLIATILSAQCTDQRVNMVTPELFRRFPAADDLARAPQSEIERIVQSTGFFRNKAKNIKECCRRLVEEHGGEVPQDLEALVRLPGIGRKTANVVLGTAYGIASGVVVDTHVGRLSIRLGLTSHKDPIKVERDLMALLPRREWIAFSHRMIHHGRRICVARSPKCDICPLNDICPKIGVVAPAKKRLTKR